MVQAVSFQGVEYCRPGKIFMLGRLFFLEGDDEVIIKLFKKIVGLQLGKCIRQGFRWELDEMRGVNRQLSFLLRSDCKFEKQFCTEISLLCGWKSTLAVRSGK